MSTTTVVVVVIVVVLLVGLGVVVALASRRRTERRKHLRDQFGQEYQRTVSATGSTRRAESELAAREKRRAELGIKPLVPGRADQFRSAWTGTQSRFVDHPEAAVGEADRLVTRLMAERGYPTDDFEQQVADLSVDHADVLDHYRKAHRIGGSAEDASTEALRQAMVHYRFLFDRLLVEDEAAEVSEAAEAAEAQAQDEREADDGVLDRTASDHPAAVDPAPDTEHVSEGSVKRGDRRAPIDLREPVNGGEPAAQVDPEATGEIDLRDRPQVGESLAQGDALHDSRR